MRRLERKEKGKERKGEKRHMQRKGNKVAR